MARPDPFDLNDVFAALFGDGPGEIDPAGHPPEERLSAYRARQVGPGQLDPETWWAHTEGRADATDWSRQAITAHLMVCSACRERYHALPAAPPESPSLWERLADWSQSVREAFSPTPRPAMIAMAAQSTVIVGLVAALLTGFLAPGPSSGGPASELAPATSSATPEVEAQSASPAEPSERAAGGESPSALADRAQPTSVAQQIQILANSDDPQTRLVAARELQSWSDPSLVPQLTQIYQRESHPQVRQALNRTINAIMSNMATQYDSAVKAIQEFQGRAELPSQDLMSDAQRLFGQLFGEEATSASSGASTNYSGALTCAASAGLTLSQLRRLSSELGGMMVVDHSLPADSFRMRLPFSAGLAESLRRLEDEMGLRCYQE